MSDAVHKPSQQGWRWWSTVEVVVEVVVVNKERERKREKAATKERYSTSHMRQ
jgi:hypothetical protein